MILLSYVLAHSVFIGHLSCTPLVAPLGLWKKFFKWLQLLKLILFTEMCLKEVQGNWMLFPEVLITLSSAPQQWKSFEQLKAEKCFLFEKFCIHFSSVLHVTKNSKNKKFWLQINVKHWNYLKSTLTDTSVSWDTSTWLKAATCMWVIDILQNCTTRMVSMLHV